MKWRTWTRQIICPTDWEIHRARSRSSRQIDLASRTRQGLPGNRDTLLVVVVARLRRHSSTLMPGLVLELGTLYESIISGFISLLIAALSLCKTAFLIANNVVWADRGCEFIESWLLWGSLIFLVCRFCDNTEPHHFSSQLWKQTFHALDAFEDIGRKPVVEPFKFLTTLYRLSSSLLCKIDSTNAFLASSSFRFWD